MLKTLVTKAAALTGTCLFVLSVLAVAAPSVEASYTGGKADCNTNAIINCGVDSVPELKQKYHADSFVRVVYAHFTIPSEASLNGMVRGRVTKSGEVWVGNERLATGAVTAGRIKMGADEVQVPGATAWMRPPSVSFKADSLEALIKLNSRGEFQFGVLMSCGNPVQAANKVRKPAPKPQPTPAPTPQPTPTPQPQPTPQTHPSLSIKKFVRLGAADTSNNNPWSDDQITAKPGDTVSWEIAITNTGDTDLTNVQARDILPSEFSFPVNATLGGNSTVLSGLTVDQLVHGDGINLGTLARGQKLTIDFSVTAGNVDACQNGVTNFGFAKADNVTEKSDQAKVKICQTPATPTTTQPTTPQVKGEQTTTPNTLPNTGPAGIVAIFSGTSAFGFALYKLKDFYAVLLK